MEDDVNLCCICGKPLAKGTGRVPFYFCTDDYHKYTDDIINKSSWTRYLINWEKQRRKKRNRRLGAQLRGGV